MSHPIPSRYAGPAASTGLQQPGGVGAVGRMCAARAPRGPSAFLQPYGRAASTRPEVSAGFNTVSDTPAGPPPDRPGPLSAFQSQPGPAAASQPSTRGRRRHRCCPRGHGPKVPPAPSHAPAWQCQPSPLSYCHSWLLRHREAPRQHTKGKIRLQKGSGMGLSARCTRVVQPAPAAAPPGTPWPQPSSSTHCRGQPPPGSGGKGPAAPPVRGDGGTAEGLEEAGAGTLGLRSKGRENSQDFPPLGGQGAPTTRRPLGLLPWGKTASLGAGEGSQLPKSQSRGQSCRRRSRSTL